MRRAFALIFALALAAGQVAFAADPYGKLTANGSADVTTSAGIHAAWNRIVLQGDAAASFTWTVYGRACADCTEIQYWTGNETNLPIDKTGRPGNYSWRIVVSSYSAGTLYYRVVQP